MEVLGVLFIPLMIAYFVAPIAAFFMALSNRRTTAELFERIAQLDRRLSAAQLGAAPPAGAPAPLTPPITPSPSVTPESAFSTATRVLRETYSRRAAASTVR